MSIKFAILGILSWKPSTGYDLKKFFEESSSMYWSGNNNQIYKALLKMQEDGLVTNEIVHQDNSPSKKVYTITSEGLSELKEWVMSNPQTPEFKKTFLVQLAWSDLLNEQELNELLSKYENELKLQLVLQQEKNKRKQYSPGRSNREILLWDAISKNIISSYKNELDWLQQLRQDLFKNLVSEENKMNYQVISNKNQKYLELTSASIPLSTEQDAVDLIALCGDADTNLLLLHYNALSKDFFKLKTGISGKILQKFVNYHVKAAILIPDKTILKGKFKEMATEANKNNQFRIFETKEDAEEWLIK